MSNDIIKKIKLLRTVEPDENFRKTNRDILLMQIKNTLDVAQKTNNILLEALKIFLPWSLFATMARSALVLFLIFGLALGSVLSVSAAEASLPGDPLYPLKLVTEKIQVSLTFKEEKKTEMHVELAGKRIDEVKKIKDKAEPPVQKSKKINVAVGKFKEEIENVKAKLEVLDKKVESQKVVEVAKIIDTKVSEYQDTLEKVVDELEPPVKKDIKEEINQGLETVEKIGEKALEVIVNKHVKGEAALPEEEVVKRLEKKIEIVENKIAKVEEQVTSLNVNVLPTDSSQNSEMPSETVKTTTQQAKEVLTEAKELINQKNLDEALNKVIESKELVKQVEQIVTETAALTSSSEAGADLNVNTNTASVNADTNAKTSDENINSDLNSNANVELINNNTNSTDTNTLLDKTATNSETTNTNY